MKKLKEQLSKRQYIIFILSLIIVLLLTFSYAFYLNTDNTLENISTTECFKLTLNDSNDINLDKTYPISDEEGSLLNPYTFTIKNVCNKAGDYQVNIETLNESDLSTNYLKYKLDNQSPSILGNQLEVQEYINENVKESKNIETGVILPNEEITYNLRIWIDEASTYEQTSNKIYKSKVVVKTIDNKEPYQTITLNANGGDLSSNEIIKVKTRTIGEIPIPTKTGYSLEGWYLDQALTNKIDDNTIVTDEINNLYAKYTPNKYTVTFDPDGGSVSETTKEVTYDSTYGSLPTPTRVGYTFKGWSILPNGYQQVEYLRGSTGYPYIDTEFMPNQDTSAEVDGFEPSSNSLYGVSPIFNITGLGNSGLMAIDYANDRYVSDFKYTDRHVYKQLKNEVYIDNQLVHVFTPSLYSSDKTLLVFARKFTSNSNISDYSAKGTIYYLKIWDDKELVRNYIPCKRNDNTYGLYDTVNNKFYGNINESSSFTGGNTIYIISNSVVNKANNHTLTAVWEPMYPAPPANKIFISDLITSIHQLNML